MGVFDGRTGLCEVSLRLTLTGGINRADGVGFFSFFSNTYYGGRGVISCPVGVQGCRLVVFISVYNTRFRTAIIAFCRLIFKSLCSCASKSLG